tara:strand:+ start:672 stop:941 length:270 start_codon:yes stop_codon:yes gene_type:complete
MAGKYKSNIPKASPVKKGRLKFQHNLDKIIGLTLYDAYKAGKFDPRSLERFSANLGVDLGGNYSASIGYNEYMKDLRQDLKLTISRKLK